MHHSPSVPVTTSDIPSVLILETEDILGKLKQHIAELDMPVVDIELACEIMFDVLQPLCGNYRDVDDACVRIANGEGLIENSDEDNGIDNRLWTLAFGTTLALRMRLEEIGAYRNGNLLYKFRRTINGTNLVLDRNENPV